MLKNLANFAQKTLYFGVGLVSMAADKAAMAADKVASQLPEMNRQSQKLVSELVGELVKRGEMTTEEATAFVNDVIKKANQSVDSATSPTSASGQASNGGSGPRKITIDDMDSEDSEASTALALTEAARLRQQIDQLQAELDRLKA